MFGFLVVVLPTRHEGGSLPLRHHGREWVLNSADIVSPQNSESPRAAFVAFFGDIEHEVSVVKSGYRVTLTYNLYFGDDKSTIVPSTMLPIDDDTEAKIKKSLIALLNNRKFFPDGGLLGVGLIYQYPINKDTILNELDESLKGADATIKRVCDSLSLDLSVKMVYKSSQVNGVACFLDELADPGLTGEQVEEDIALYLQREYDGLLVFDPDSDVLSLKELRYNCPYYDGVRSIVWLRPLAERDDFKTPYVRYGNEPTLEYVYGEICLVVDVEASKDRKVYM